MTGAVFTEEFSLPPENQREITRYMGGAWSPETESLILQCAKEARGILTPRICYARFPISFRQDTLDLGFASTQSKGLKKNLAECREIIVFAATVGISLDRLIARYEKISPAKALCLHAIGAERVEELCDRFCYHMKENLSLEGKETCPRFSPGYGDLSLELQRDIFRVLDCPRRIGLTLNESLLMSPSKSVTAIFGIKERQ